MLSEKKIFKIPGYNSISIDYIVSEVNKFNRYFWAHRFDNTGTALNYVLGLLKCTKGQANMERMEEEIENSEYRAYQQFISNSNWDCDGLLNALAQEASTVLAAQKQQNSLPTGYIIDESAHLKKGKKSVGVSRQYAGVAGKVDNCQVGVYASLVNENDATIINERLFLPEAWTNDKIRCKLAGVPEAFRSFKTKPELALEMLKQDIARGVKFDWIGGDGLYGHNYELGKAIDILNLFFVLDVHKDETVYLEEPTLGVPEKKMGRGRNPTNVKALQPNIRLDKILQQLTTDDWKLEDIRDSVKGKIRLFVHKAQVWTWDGKELAARKRTLIITKTADKQAKIKYSFSNGEVDQYSHKEYAYFVAQRYWVERTFDNAKNELGMSDYQTQGWKSWHHHHALIMLASLFIMKQQMDNHSDVPLLSFRDARILVILQVFGTPKDIQLRLEQMAKRHHKRKLDIDYCYSKQAQYQGLITS
jgi:SRSO17 transposase